MTTADLWSETPKNRYAAERSSAKAGHVEQAGQRDAHAARRRVSMVLACIMLITNLALLAAVIPAITGKVARIIALPDLGAPHR